MRVLELFCGIGGAAAALPAGWTVAAAVDVNRNALAVYGANFPRHPAFARTLDAVDAGELARHRADLWWLSPPCQPHTTRGRRRDLDDPRSAALAHLAGCLERVRPPAVALENVPGFAGSAAHRLVRATLERAGYTVREALLCPSELGLPNRRRRFYLVAGRAGAEPRPLAESPEPAATAPSVETAVGPERPLARFLDRRPARELAVPTELVRRFGPALDVVDPNDPKAITACFTSAYGRSPVRSGSYLLLSESSAVFHAEDEGGEEEPRPENGPSPQNGGAGGAEEKVLRRFSPTEILRLLDFPAGYSLPPDLVPERAWPLVGNSLAVAAVRRVLAAFPA